ncbi:MAG: PaaI family thioesterase [Alphaproteobacteria bacterium]|nr:PaaI family thioesterase [Alphaproteobacteria bacterium]
MTPNHPHFPPLMAFALHRFIGVDCVDAREGAARFTFVVTDAMLTPSGGLHAGFIYTVCDLAAYAALMTTLSDTEGAVTHDLHVSVMRTARSGERVDVDAGIVRRGRTLCFLDARATCGERLLATARITKSLVSI